MPYCQLAKLAKYIAPRLVNNVVYVAEAHDSAIPYATEKYSVTDMHKIHGSIKSKGKQMQY